MSNHFNYSPKTVLDRDEIIDLSLISVALQGIELSYLLHRQSEKIEHIEEEFPESTHHVPDIYDSTERILRYMIKNQMLLQSQLEDIVKRSGESFDLEF